MRFRPTPAAWLSGVAALLVAGSALAATVQRLDIAGLTRLSTHVVTGRILSNAPAWTPDGGAVVTLHQLQVLAVWKGALSGESLIVRTPGGRMGDYTMELPGAPEIRAGEEVLLFLEHNDDGSFGIVSLAQGSYRFAAAPDGTLLVTRDPGAAHLVTPHRDGGVEKLPALIDTVDSVRRQVEAALEAERAGQAETEIDAVPLHDVTEGGVR